MRFIKICAGVFALASILISVSYMLHQFGPEGTTEFINALEDAPANSVIRLSDYISFQASEVCLLAPYQYEIASDDSQYASEINEEIRKKPFGYDTDQFWKIIFFNKGKMEVIRPLVHRIGKIKNKDFGEVERHLFLRVAFLQKSCSDFSSAAFMKIESGGHIFLAFGGIINGIH